MFLSSIVVLNCGNQFQADVTDVLGGWTSLQFTTITTFILFVVGLLEDDATYHHILGMVLVVNTIDLEFES